MKKIVSLLLVFCLTAGLWAGVDLSVQAETTGESVTAEEYIYYTDLFYAYPYYLANDEYFAGYAASIENMYESVHTAYQESDLKIATGIGSALENITSPTDMAKLITDTLGLTDFSYNDALDAANEEVVRNLVSDSLVYSLEKEFGKVASWNKKIDKVVAKFNELKLTSDSGQISYSAEYYVQEAFDALHDGGYFSYISDEMIANLWVEINAEDFALSDCFELASLEIEIAEAIVSSIMLEDIRLEIVNDIIATQSSDTILKQGMQRLKSKLQGNFATHFIENYLLEKVADKVFGTIDSWVVGAVMTPKLVTLLNFAKTVFNKVVEYPSVQEVLKWQTLICYSKDMANGITGLAQSYSEGIFLSDKIITYENMFIAYDAINKAASTATMSVKDMLDPFAEVFTIRNEAIANGQDTLLIKYADKEVVIPVGASDEELLDILYEDTFEDVDGSVYDIPDKFEISNGISSATISVKANCFASALQASVIASRGAIDAFEATYSNVSLYGEHIASVLETIYNTPEEDRQIISEETYSGWTYTLTSTVQLRRESDTVEKGCYYAVDGYMLGNANVKGYTVPSELEIGIAGNVELGCWESLTVSQNAIFNVKGNLRVTAWAYADAYRSTITSNGCLRVYGKVYGYGNFYGSGQYIFYNVDGTSLNFKNATYELKDDTQNGIAYENARVIISGENQTVNLTGTLKSLDVYATGLSLTPDVTISEYIDFHGNDVTVSDYIDIASTATVVEGSNYKRLNFPNRYTLTNDIRATYMYFKGGLTVNSGSYTLTGNVDFWYGNDFVIINEGASLKISGYISGTEWRWQPIRTGITNNGELTVTGTTYYRFNLGGSGVYNLNNIYSTNAYIKFSKATFNVKGSVTSGQVTVDKVKCINVCGTGSQSLNFTGSISKLVLENTVETTFTSAIKVTTLFNHKGNSFTLNAGGTFVDYDGDGMKDNVDPEPTVGNPCVVTCNSNDESFGTVSESEISTCGGTELTVTATPTAKYTFVKWINSSGSTVSTSAEYTFVVKGDTSLTAVFEKRSQPITVECTGGTISAPSSAVIESEVQVTVAEEEGYVYTEGSLMYNDIVVENNSFIMPDESVTLTAEFVRNEAYFLLKEKIEEAEAYTYEEYSAESFAELQQAIENASDVHVNDISEETATEQVEKLDEAITGLTERYVANLEAKTIPDVYVGLENLQEEITLTVTYDNGIVLDTTEYTVANYQKDIVGIQEVTLEYEGATVDISIQVVLRSLNDCTVSEIAKQVYAGQGTTNEPSVEVVYGATGEELVSEQDYTVMYSNNTSVGVATATIIGIGIYEGTLEKTFEIYCEHVYVEQEYQAPTCTEDGCRTDVCSICEDVVHSVQDAVGHSYAENGTFVKYPVTEGNAVFEYRCTECDSSVSFESLDSMIGESSIVLPEGMTDLGTVTSTKKGFSTKVSFSSTEWTAMIGFALYYSNASEPGEDGYVLIIAPGEENQIQLVLQEPNYGDSPIIEVVSDISIEDFSISTWVEDGRFYIVVDETHIFSCEIDEAWVTGNYCEAESVSNEVAEIRTVEKLPYLRFSGASLTLQNNLAIKYRVKKSVIDGFYENPYAVFEMAGKQTKVTSYTEDGDYYLFEFKNIAPNQMNDTICATLYGEFNGKEYASATVEYSVATYCYNMLPKLTSDSYVKLRTLLVDLLNYGAEAQIYTDYNTDNLVNAALTEEQAAWGTQGDPELETVLNTKYATVESPSVTWKNAILNLKDSITIQVMLATEDTTDLKVKFTDKDGKVLATVSESQFVETDGGYYVNFKGLHAGQMSEAIYITAYRDDVAVSNTVQYSIESYAYSKQNSDYLNLGDLVKAMMKYGNAAYAYSN